MIPEILYQYLNTIPIGLYAFPRQLSKFIKKSWGGGIIVVWLLSVDVEFSIDHSYFSDFVILSYLMCFS